MELALRSELTLDDFHGDPNALVKDYFKVYCSELPEREAATMAKVADLFFARHARTRFKNFFNLTVNQAESVLTDAGAPEGYRASIEQPTGFTFREPNVPESASFITVNKRKRPVEETVPSSRASRTVAARMTHTEFLNVQLSESCYEVILTEDPANNEIEEPEVKAFIDACLEDMAYKHGSWSLGAPLVRAYMKPAKKRLKLPNRGKVRGHERDLAKMVLDKIKNRTNVRCI